MLQAIQKCTFLPFQEPIEIKGNHRTHIYELNYEILFQGPAPNNQNNSSGTQIVQSRHYKQAQEFCAEVVKGCTSHHIYDSLAQLSEITSFQDNDHKQLEKLDQQFTKILLESEKAVKHYISERAWSPTLHQAWLLYRYGKLQISQLQTNKDLSKQLQDIEGKLSIDQYFGHPGQTTSSYLQTLKKNLQDIQSRARSLRKEYLLQEITEAMTMDEATRRKRLQAILNAEIKNQSHRKIRQFVKPCQQGGLSYILIPENGNDNQWVEVSDAQEMENHLLHAGKLHFSQAHGTPFRVDPLSTLTGYNGLSEFGTEIINGDLEIVEGLRDVDKVTKLLLKHSISKVFKKGKIPPGEEISATIDIQDIMRGFRLWKERTNTSPSGLHLGIYKSLLKGSTALGSDKNIQTGQDVYKIIHLLINLAVQHTHVYNRWTTIHNLCLRKNKTPKINRLQTIHLYKADYNFILKWFGAKEMMRFAKKMNNICREQIGGHKDKNAVDGAMSKVLSFDHIRLMKLPAVNVDNDAKACYDQIIESFSNMALRRHGTPEEFLKLHGLVHQQLRYFIKHKHGISSHSNGWSEDSPWYGSGQGARDSPAHWILISDSIIAANNSKAKRWKVLNPDGSVATIQGVQAYVDDTTILLALNNEEDIETLFNKTQDNVNLWN